MSFILMLKSMFRALFYRMPKVGDVYVYDCIYEKDKPLKVKITCSFVRSRIINYKFLGDYEKYNICQNQTYSRFWFHLMYKKVNEEEKV